MKKIPILILLLVLIGCIVGIYEYITYTEIYTGITNPETQKSYSDGSITFKYPAIFPNNTSKSPISIEEEWSYLLDLNEINGTARIFVEKNENGSSSEEVYQYLANALTNDNLYTHQKTPKTNPNGIKIFKLVYSHAEAYDDAMKHINFIFEDKKGNVYVIYIYL